MKAPLTRDLLREQLEGDFGKDAQMIADASRNAIILSIEGAGAGASRAFGDPEVPKGTKWPLSEDDSPLAFIVQIDLAAIAEHDIEKKLPREGLLAFFLRPDQLLEDDAGYYLPCAVLHATAKRETLATPQSLANWALPAMPVSASHGFVMPELDQLPRELKRGEKRYSELLVKQLELPEDQMLAFPTGTHDDNVPPKNGQVLLSTRLPPQMFDGSFSWAYFCISDEDLAARRFDRVVVRISTE